jgi:alpha-glutamyl/putrescinyl thymine pyrophosphorylase clade 1
MSLLAVFNTQMPAPDNEELEEADSPISLVPPSTVNMNLSDDEGNEEVEECIETPHQVSPDVSPATKSGSLLGRGGEVDPMTSTGIFTQEEEVPPSTDPVTLEEDMKPAADPLSIEERIVEELVVSLATDLVEELLQDTPETKEPVESLVKEEADALLTRTSSRKRIPNAKYVEQKYAIGTRVRKHFYGYDTPFWGIVTRYDPHAQYYGVTYVADGDEEEYDEFELSQIIVKPDYGKGVTDDLPKYGIGTQVGKWFGSEFYFGTITSHDAQSEYYLITYEDDDQEEIEEWEISDLIAAVQENWNYKRGGKKKLPRIKTEDQSHHITPVKNPVKKKASPNPEDLCLWANIGLKTEKEIEAVLEQMTMVPVPQRRSVAEFFLFIYMRQVWFRARQQQKLTGTPATLPNRAMREHVFCNMYRELDRGTQWIRQRLAPLHSGEDMSRREWTLQVLWMCYNYRQIGRTETFLTLGFPKLIFQEPDSKSTKEGKKSVSMEQFNKKSVTTFTKGMRKLMSEGVIVFTGVYQTPPMRMYEKFVMAAIADGCALLQQVADAILDYDPEDEEFDFFSYHENICNALQALPGISCFFGWQLFCDLEEVGCIPRHPSMSLALLQEGPTEPPYVLLGSGARKGLKIVFGRGTVSYDQQLEEVNFMIQNQLAIHKALGVQFDFWNGQTLSCKVFEYVLVVSMWTVPFLEIYTHTYIHFFVDTRSVSTSSIVVWWNV